MKTLILKAWGALCALGRMIKEDYEMCSSLKDIDTMSEEEKQRRFGPW